jgi:hypothetical protein
MLHETVPCRGVVTTSAVEIGAHTSLARHRRSRADLEQNRVVNNAVRNANNAANNAIKIGTQIGNIGNGSGNRSATGGAAAFTSGSAWWRSFPRELSPPLPAAV